MTTVYIDNEGAPTHLPYSLVFWPNFRFPIAAKRLFLREIISQYERPFFDVLQEPEQADFFAVPFEYFFVRDTPYIERVYAKAKSLGKKVLLFDYTDWVDKSADLPSHAVLFRVSLYRHHEQPNEIAMPYFVQDFGACYGIDPKEKGEPLQIGFCGQSRFGSVARAVRAYAKRMLYAMQLRLRGDANAQVHARGIFWRRRAINALCRERMRTEIIERPFYSLFRAQGLFDPETIRREYVENLRACDMALCIRGDSNASQRFYEALSASRIPLLLDTDCVLPLEKVVPYDEVILCIPYGGVDALPARVSAWAAKESPDSFMERERAARKLYADYLRLDRFFERVFDKNTSPYRELLYPSRKLS